MVTDRSRGRVASGSGAPAGPLRPRRRDDVAHVPRAALLRLAGAALGRRRAHASILPVARVPELPRRRLRAAARARAAAARPQADGASTRSAPRARTRDPARGVVDADLRLHGADGVHVADGSAVPSPLGVNPQITIMALATRLAHPPGEEVPACPS